jgi:hypothetical protein
LRLAGFSAVNREKLKRLTDEQVAGLFRTDELELIYLHLQSMRNFNSLVKRSATQESASTTGTKAGEAEAQDSSSEVLH